MASSEIVDLNVGGTRFSTSRQTLLSIPDTFFSALLSGRIASHKDESGATFIDRDPVLFSIILNFLRTKEVDFNRNSVDPQVLQHEAEYFGITPLVRRLILCEELDRSNTCGDLLFHGYISAPKGIDFSTERNEPIPKKTSIASQDSFSFSPFNGSNAPSRPGSVMRVNSQVDLRGSSRTHSRNSSLDFRAGHSRNSSLDMRVNGHSRNPSLDLLQSKASFCDGKSAKTDLTFPVCFTGKSMQVGNPDHACFLVEPQRQCPDSNHNMQVTLIACHLTWIAVAYPYFLVCYRIKDATGWQQVFVSPILSSAIERIAITSKLSGSQQQAQPPPPDGRDVKMVACAYGPSISLWSINEDGAMQEVGTFSLGVSCVDSLFFIGTQLVSISGSKIGIWHAVTQQWQVQELGVAVTAYDTAGSFLLLGGANGTINYIDMQKFPLRMKDNDLLITELYRDTSGDAITALSVYLTPKTSLSGNWIEIAYGTSTGIVRVIVQHPETVGHGPQLFQTFTVHRSPICKVMLSEKHLISVCSDYNHVRTWTVTRFRGMISTQPGSTPLASFKVISLEDVEPSSSYACGNDIGPYGERDDQQIFVQKVIPATDELFIRLSSNGRRVCDIRAVDGSIITSFSVHEFEGSSRMGSRPRRYLFTGHANGSVQIWDLTTALEKYCKLTPTPAASTTASTTVTTPAPTPTSSSTSNHQSQPGGPTPEELLRFLNNCDISSSQNSTPCVSPSSSMLSTLAGSRLRILPPSSSTSTGADGTSSDSVSQASFR